MLRIDTVPAETRGEFQGLVTLDRGPSTKTAGELAVYNELWSKLRWAIGSTLLVQYTKRSRVGELARRFALLSLRNIEDPL